MLLFFIYLKHTNRIKIFLLKFTGRKIFKNIDNRKISGNTLKNLSYFLILLARILKV